MNEKPNPRFRFTLRALLVVMLLLGCALLPVVVRMNETKKQRAAVEAIEKLGGVVIYFHQVGNGMIDGNAQPAASPWMRRMLGDHYFFRVRQVSFGEHVVSDSDLIHLEHLSELKSLDLFDSRISDTGLEQLGTLTSLESLVISSDQISDSGLMNLKGLGNLRLMTIYSSSISEEGISRLKERLPDCDIFLFDFSHGARTFRA